MQIAGGGSDRMSCGGKAPANETSIDSSAEIGYSMAVRSGGSRRQDVSTEVACEGEALAYQAAVLCGIEDPAIGEPDTSTGNERFVNFSKDRKAADDLASDILQQKNGTPTTSGDVWNVLQIWKSKKNYMRAKARPEGETWVLSETLGIVKPLVGDIQISQCSLAYPSMALLLNQYLTCSMSEAQKRDFKWTSISVNQGFAARRHRDTGNAGPSMIASFGKFRGGRLNYWEDDDGKTNINDLPDSAAVKLDIKNNVVAFDGRRAHGVARYHGERCSIVWFSANKAWEFDAELLRKNEALGFRSPTTIQHCDVSTWFPQANGFGGIRGGKALAPVIDQNPRPVAVEPIGAEKPGKMRRGGEALATLLRLRRQPQRTYLGKDPGPSVLPSSRYYSNQLCVGSSSVAGAKPLLLAQNT